MCHHLQLYTRVFPHLTRVQVYICQVGPTQLSLVVSSAASCACCPVCHHWSWRIHSRWFPLYVHRIGLPPLKRKFNGAP